ncbi:hypothetical protein C8F01DRAFT_1172774 [Mycena amicta]|nr:hypothetical protein C8F01DRAFT_1172774 [Mycena amicta]
MQFTLLASLAVCAAVVAAKTTPISAQATFFSAGGNVGVCGTPIQDTDFVVALPSSLFDASLCGKKLIINHLIPNGENVVEAVIADECIACTGDNIDLTEAAFEALAPLSEGLIDVTYEPSA